jgi:hypothetical protein
LTSFRGEGASFVVDDFDKLHGNSGLVVGCGLLERRADVLSMSVSNCYSEERGSTRTQVRVPGQACYFGRGGTVNLELWTVKMQRGGMR